MFDVKSNRLTKAVKENGNKKSKIVTMPIFEKKKYLKYGKKTR